MSGPYLDDLIIQLQHTHAYIIQMVSRDSWYFFDMDTVSHPHPVLWTKHIEQAFWFPDEQSVEEFKQDHIIPRKVEILRIDRRGR